MISKLISHCFFVGNCIGVRNHKAFFLFIVTAFLKYLIGFFVILSKSCFFIFDNQIYYKTLFKNYYYVFLFILLGMIKSFYSFFKNNKKRGYFFLFFSIANFFILKLIQKNHGKINIEISIFLDLLLLIYLIALIFSFIHLKTQIYLISKKITLKEYVVIKDKNLIKSYKIFDCLKNILSFLLKPIEKSDI